jgi:hypothetical protein
MQREETISMVVGLGHVVARDFALPLWVLFGLIQNSIPFFLFFLSVWQGLVWVWVWVWVWGGWTLVGKSLALFAALIYLFISPFFFTFIIFIFYWKIRLCIQSFFR